MNTSNNESNNGSITSNAAKAHSKQIEVNQKANFRLAVTKRQQSKFFLLGQLSLLSFIKVHFKVRVNFISGQ